MHRQSKGMLISDADLFVFCSHIGPSCKLGLSEGMEPTQTFKINCSLECVNSTMKLSLGIKQFCFSFASTEPLINPLSKTCMICEFIHHWVHEVP